jgi:hypothetical protein
MDITDSQQHKNAVRTQNKATEKIKIKRLVSLIKKVLNEESLLTTSII